MFSQTIELAFLILRQRGALMHPKQSLQILKYNGEGSLSPVYFSMNVMVISKDLQSVW